MRVELEAEYFLSVVVHEDVVASPAVLYLHRQPMLPCLITVLVALAHRVVVLLVSRESMLLLAAPHHRPLEDAVLVAERGPAHSTPNALEHLQLLILQQIPMVDDPLLLRVRPLD